MQKCGKILRGRKDTLAPVVSTLRGGDRPRRPRRSDASELGHLSAVRRKHIILSVKPNAAPSAAVDWPLFSYTNTSCCSATVCSSTYPNIAVVSITVRVSEQATAISRVRPSVCLFPLLAFKPIDF